MDYFCLAIYALTVLICYLLSTRFFFIALSPLISQLWTATSAVYLSNSESYMYELNRYSKENDQSGYLSLYYLLFLIFSLVAYWLVGFLRRYRNSRSANIDISRFFPLYSIFFYASILVLILNVLLSGSPLLEHYDRFNFWDQSRFPLLKRLSDQIFVLAIIFSTLQLRNIQKIRTVNKDKWFDYLPILTASLFCLLYEILIGEKFSGIVIVLTAFLVPFAIYYPKRIVGLAPKILPLIFIITIPFLFLTFKNTYKVDNPITSIVNRIFVAQGQLWYMTANSRSIGDMYDLQPIVSELTTSDGASYQIGIYRLMSKYGNLWLAYDYLNRGVRMAMGFPAIMVDYYGFTTGAFYVVFVGILFGLFAKLFELSLLRGGLLEIALLAKILLGLYVVATDGTLSLFFNLSVVIYISLYLLVRLFGQLIRQRFRRGYLWI